MLTRKQHELLLYINERLSETGVSPSFEEMKEALDLKSKSGVHRLISALEERGFIRRLPNRARALEVLRMPDTKGAGVAETRGAYSPLPTAANDIVDIRVEGRIAAGRPIEALSNTESVSVPAAFLGRGEHFALEVAGDSMVEEGIFDGDYVLIRKQPTANDGEIVVAVIGDEVMDEDFAAAREAGMEATLKRFRREGQMIRLDPGNRAYEPQRYHPSQVRIQGKLAALLRRY